MTLEVSSVILDRQRRIEGGEHGHADQEEEAKRLPHRTLLLALSFRSCVKSLARRRNL